MSGRVTYALNAHSELCVVHKLGGTPVSVDQMLECAHVAAAKVRACARTRLASTALHSRTTHRATVGCLIPPACVVWDGRPSPSSIC